MNIDDPSYDDVTTACSAAGQYAAVLAQVTVAGNPMSGCKPGVRNAGNCSRDGNPGRADQTSIRGTPLAYGHLGAVVTSVARVLRVRKRQPCPSMPGTAAL